MIYLDNGATTFVKPKAVQTALQEAYADMSVNAGRGSYKKARQAADCISECKYRLLRIAGLSKGYSVYLSPSATISFNQIILGMRVDSFTNVYVTPFEHNAVIRPIEAIRNKEGLKVSVLPFARDTWDFEEEKAAAAFAMEKPDYVFVSLVSNTTGYILPVKEITALAHKFGARVIVDCAQAFGSLDIDYADIYADAYVFAGHKTLYGPFGVGGMILRDDWDLPYGLYGGTGSDSLNRMMPTSDAGGYEPGSPNTPAILGLNAALKWLDCTGVKAIAEHERKLIARLAISLSQLDKVHVFAPPLPCMSSILAFAIEDYDCRDVGDILDEEFDIAVRTGYQCAPLVHDWLGSKCYGGVVRASVSFYNSESDIDALVEALKTF